VATLTKHLEELKKAEETHACQAPDVKLISSKWLLSRRTFYGVFWCWNTQASSTRGLSKLREAALTITVCAMVFAVGLGWMLCWWYLHR
jgi:hypothetical protein